MKTIDSWGLHGEENSKNASHSRERHHDPLIWQISNGHAGANKTHEHAKETLM